MLPLIETRTNDPELEIYPSLIEASVETNPLYIEQVFVHEGFTTLGSSNEEKEYAYRIGGEEARQGKWFDNENNRDLFINDFYIDRYPITQGQYLEFVLATGHRYPYISKADYADQGFLVHPYTSVTPYLWQLRVFGSNRDNLQYAPPRGRADDPVVLVSHADATSYCSWRAESHPQRNFRLPYAEEWEKAARGTNGRYFPWGNAWDDKFANIWQSGPHGTTPVTHYDKGQSPYGLNDMAGNVFEWTLSPGAATTDRFILKSCSWDDRPGLCRGAALHSRH